MSSAAATWPLCWNFEFIRKSTSQDRGEAAAQNSAMHSDGFS